MSAQRKEPDAGFPPGQIESPAQPTPAAEKLREQVRTENRDREAKKESLNDRIRRTEKRIADRRLILAARTSDVTGKMRGTLASPLLMIGAAGAGFVLAQFHRRRDRDGRKRKRERDDRPEVVMKPSIFASLTDALTLGTTLLAMMPLIRSKAKEGVQEATGEVPPS